MTNTAGTAPSRPHVIPARDRLRIGVLLSGAGRTLANLFEKIALHELRAEIVGVVSSRRGVGGLQIAADHGVPNHVVSRRDYADPQQHADAVFRPLIDAGCHVVAMAGYMQHVVIPTELHYRVMNIHPSLIPAFCGKGFYGHYVHEAVLEYGAKLTGCTVHFVDNHYDHGPVILQRSVPVADHDSPESLAARVFSQECEAYPEALRRYASGNMRVDGRRVLIEAGGS